MAIMENKYLSPVKYPNAVSTSPGKYGKATIPFTHKE
jgi:hypothetical protein